jgi:hypothetical protein
MDFVNINRYCFMLNNHGKGGDIPEIEGARDEKQSQKPEARSQKKRRSQKLKARS